VQYHRFGHGVSQRKVFLPFHNHTLTTLILVLKDVKLKIDLHAILIYHAMFACCLFSYQITAYASLILNS